MWIVIRFRVSAVSVTKQEQKTVIAHAQCVVDYP